MYWKSLDHMGIQVKAADKRNFAAKHLVDAIKTKHEEQRRQRSTTKKFEKHQFAFEFMDQEVIADLLYFMVLYATNASQHNGPERRRISEFFERFVTVFFGLPEDLIAQKLASITRGTPDDDSEDAGHSELPPSRGRPRPNKKRDWLKEAIGGAGRNGTKGRGQNQDSATGSKESTPDVDSIMEDDGDVAEDLTISQVTNDRWATAMPIAFHGPNEKSAGLPKKINLKADQPFKRDFYRLHGNQTIFVLFSIFQTLYRRLLEIKESEDDARDEGERALDEKPAQKVALAPENVDFFIPPEGETYYSHTLLLIKDFINGEVEEANYQSFLRRYYLRKGWQVYTIMDLLKSLCRLGALCSSVDSKEKTPDLLEQYYRNRQLEETSYNIEINMRKQADKYVKDGELFLIEWVCIQRSPRFSHFTYYYDRFLPRSWQHCNGFREMRPRSIPTTWINWSAGNITLLRLFASSQRKVFHATVCRRFSLLATDQMMAISRTEPEDQSHWCSRRI